MQRVQERIAALPSGCCFPGAVVCSNAGETCYRGLCRLVTTSGTPVDLRCSSSPDAGTRVSETHEQCCPALVMHEANQVGTDATAPF